MFNATKEERLAVERAYRKVFGTKLRIGIEDIDFGINAIREFKDGKHN